MYDRVTHISKAAKKLDIDGVDFAAWQDKDKFIIYKRVDNKLNKVILDTSESDLLRQILNRNEAC